MRMALIVATSIVALSGTAYAQGTCKSEASAKKLAGAAQTSFMKKCETDAMTKCEKSAADKKLAGAAKTSHIKKCTKDAVGT